MRTRIPVKYQQMKEAGHSPVDVYVSIYKDGDDNARNYVAVLFDIEISSEELVNIQNAAFRIIFEKYVELHNQGLAAERIAQISHEDGFNFMRRMAMLRFVLNYSLVNTKDLIVRSDGLANSLDEYQGQFIGIIEEVLKDEESEDN